MYRTFIAQKPDYFIINRMETLLTHPLILLLIVLWTLPWKGVALWRAARLYHKWWFVALLILNTLAILEIIYIFFVVPKTIRKTSGVEETAENK